jgi:hypothetical protein
MTPFSHRLSFVVMTTVLLTAPGCGKPVGKLSGTVKHNGELVEVGMVTAVNENGEPVGSTTIQQGGTYTMIDLPPGPVTLVVLTYGLDGEPVGSAAFHDPIPKATRIRAPADTVQESEKAALPESVVKARERLKPIPLKYATAQTSDLKVTVVKAEATTFDIEMSGQGEIPKPIAIPKPPKGPIVGPRTGPTLPPRH